MTFENGFKHCCLIVEKIANEKTLTLGMLLSIVLLPVAYLLITYEKYSGKTLYCINDEYRKSFSSEITVHFLGFFRYFQKTSNYIQLMGSDGNVYQCGGVFEVK